MRLGNIYCKVMCLLMLTMLTTLWSDIGEPYKINGEDVKIYYSGPKGFRKTGETLHLTYSQMAISEENNLALMYLRANHQTEPYLPEWNISHQEINPVPWWIIPPAYPVLEVMPDGGVFVFYPVPDDNGIDWHLQRAEISPTGELLNIEPIGDDVYTEVNVANDNDNLHLLFRKGFEQSITDYHLFYDKMLSIENVPGNFRFFGQDLVYGRVHSNTDIWIRQIGGGNNNGWPTFNGLVTTAGIIRVYPGGGTNFPVEDIFRGGVIENYPELELPSGAALIRQNGIYPFGSVESEDTIYFVTIEGNSYTSMVGQIVPNPAQGMIIFDTYPPYGAVGDSIGFYSITIPDTVWTAGPSGMVNNQSVLVPGELWISGNGSGMQTWGSSHNIYIKDDITYANTIPGQPPDGGSDDQYPVNTSDMLVLVSEKSILIQYGYRDPTDGMRYKPNCDNINIYGYLFALGDGEGDTTSTGVHHKDGIFSYQYQLPKGSTPDQFYQDQLYTNIDLHLRRYPTTPFQPWPPGLDYPWYNPLWPEPGPIFDPGTPYTTTIPNPHNVPNITFLRGTINLYGGFASRRVGYIRRSGMIDFDTGVWDPDNYLFGRFPGQPSGYVKNYYSDMRFDYWYPPDTPKAVFPANITDLTYHYWKQEEGEEVFSPVHSEELLRFGDNLLLDVLDNIVAILMSNRLFLSNDTGADFQEYQLDICSNGVLDMIFAPEGVYLLTQNRLQLFNTLTNQLQTIDEMILPNREQAIAIDGGNVIWAASIDLETIRFNIYTPDGQLINQYDWLHGMDRNPYVPIEKYTGRLGLIAEGNQLYIAANIAGSLIPFWYETMGDLYLATGHLEYQSSQSIELPDNLSLHHYPNPLLRGGNNRSQKVSISFNLPEESPVKLDIFNIKGQLVSTILQDTIPQGKHIVNWDGRDERMRSVAQGIYFYKLDTGKTSMVRKILVLN